LFGAGSLLARHTAAAPRRPNLVVLLSDDMGYSDIGCYGGEIRTPNLDRLAAGGVRFTQFYNTARCCPTRAALLTGLYSHQAGVGHMMEDKGYDAYRGHLNRRGLTLAEALKPAGYRAYAVGKWHVTRHVGPGGPKDGWPLQRRFDRYYGTLTGAGSFFDPGTLTRDNTPISPFADPEYRPTDGFYYTDAITDHAIRFTSDHARTDPDRPFVLYVAYTAAHWPMHARDEDIARYRGKYDAGYAAIRRARLARMRKLGLVDPRWEPAPDAQDWEKVAHKAWEARCMEVYAAMVDRMDHGIGRLVESLRRNGQLDNTLLCYLQDNGGCAEGNGRQGSGTRPAAASLPPIPPDAIRSDTVPRQNRAGVPTLQGPGVMPGPEDTYIAYGEGWANVSNTPFRLYKHWQHEGGIATPLIVHWPAGIPRSRRGKLERQPGHLIDLMPTFLDLARATYPSQRDEMPLTPLPGVSLRPALEGRSVERREPLFWEHEGNRAVRDGRWKLVSRHPAGWELYDLDADRTEMHDLAATHPDRVRELSAKWDAWAARVGVQPWPIRPASANAALSPRRQAVLLAPEQVTRGRIEALAQGAAREVLLLLDPRKPPANAEAARRITERGLSLGYWIEVGRCPALADAHPEWMASLQGHPEWRRLFPNVGQPRTGEVVKTYPWVPILSREGFDAQLERVAKLLAGLPAARSVFLNDLQAAPSACGCGNALCRWTPDYGPIRTNTRLPADAAARFVAEVRKRVPASEVVPVWTTECEQGEKDADCAGVACFQGACWRDYTAQLMPVAAESATLAALCLPRTFGRDRDRHPAGGGWIRHALESFAEMPPKRGGTAVPARRVLAVLQGWDLPADEQAQHLRHADAAGAGGTVLALTPIEQRWEPRIVRVR
jgi:arylsulfatase